MDLRKGKKVEVCCSEEGYGGAWFEGVIVGACRGNGPCKIQYDKFVADDGKPLVEKISANEVRPIPPRRRLPLRCSIRDTVEAYDTDCWWRGVIVKLEAKIYVVYFPDTDTIKAYDRSVLRPAQEWVQGKWRLVPQASDGKVEQVIRAVLNSGEASSAHVDLGSNTVSEMSRRKIQRVHEAKIPKQEEVSLTEEEQNCRSGERGHKTQLMAYRSLLQAFHVDRCSLNEERRNLLKAIRKELHICEHEHNLAMEEMASLLRIWGSPLPFWF